jgi:hypothetical protein
VALPSVSLSFSIPWAGAGRSGLPMPRSMISAPALRDGLGAVDLLRTRRVAGGGCDEILP